MIQLLTNLILRPAVTHTGFASERHQILLLRGEFGT